MELSWSSCLTSCVENLSLTGNIFYRKTCYLRRLFPAVLCLCSYCLCSRNLRSWCLHFAKIYTPNCCLTAWLCPVITVREIYRNVIWRNPFLADIWKHPFILSDFKQDYWTRDVQISEVTMQKWIFFYAKKLNAEPLFPRDQCFDRMLYCHEWVWKSL